MFCEPQAAVGQGHGERVGNTHGRAGGLTLREGKALSPSLQGQALGKTLTQAGCRWGAEPSAPETAAVLSSGSPM